MLALVVRCDSKFGANGMRKHSRTLCKETITFLELRCQPFACSLSSAEFTGAQSRYLANSQDWDSVEGSSDQGQAGDIAVYANPDGRIGHIIVRGSDGEWYDAALGSHAPQKSSHQNPNAEGMYELYRFSPKRPSRGSGYFVPGSPSFYDGLGGAGRPSGVIRI